MVPDYQSDLLLLVKTENQQQSRVSDVSNNIMQTSEVNYAVFHTSHIDCTSPITLAQMTHCIPSESEICLSA